MNDYSEAYNENRVVSYEDLLKKHCMQAKYCNPADNRKAWGV